MFLLRTTHAAAADNSPPTPDPAPIPASAPAGIAAAATAITASSSPQVSKNLSSQSQTLTALEGLISADSFSYQDGNGENRPSGSDNGSLGTYVKDHTPMLNRHVDVTEDEGWIVIPRRELPSSWNEASDIQTFRPLDRSFIFPGEQVHILACLSASNQDAEIVTPFKLAAVMSKNGVRPDGEKQEGNIVDEDRTLSESGQEYHDEGGDSKEGKSSMKKNDSQMNVSSGESLIRMEDHRKRMQKLLQRFKESHFFVRIVESDELLWSARSSMDTNEAASSASEDGAGCVKSSANSINAMIDKGRFDARVCGGAARNSVKCFSLPSGDIVVLLQVNVSVDHLKEPTLEILQFEKLEDRNLTSEHSTSVITTDGADEIKSKERDPCGELLKWLLPLDKAPPPLSRPISPPLSNAPPKTSFSASSGSQLFSFGHFRSYSMSSASVPPISGLTSPSVSSGSTRPSFELEDWDRVASQSFVKSQKAGSEGVLSFRGVPLESERFSVRCGLEGTYMPGRRWKKHLEIVQPICIHTFSAYCNTDDLLCVQIKNVSPAHIPDLIVYIDAITLIFEEASKGGLPLSIPVTCIEAGSDYCFPSIALRRGEEHSFILKPETSPWKQSKTHSDGGSQLPLARSNKQPLNVRVSSKATEREKILSTSDEYSVLVSCRCNYTESRLFFKRQTQWRPRIYRDLMVSVASETSKKTLEHDSRVSQLPVQVLTLQASNLTMEDLTLTILAPASLTSHPTVVSLNSAPSTPMTPFVGFSTTKRLSSMPLLVENQKHEDYSPGVRSLSLNEQTVPISDYIPTTALACNHLWLQSRVPLGCIPAQSTKTVKLELLPLTDGIITLDTLQITVKEKGVAYIPEQSLKINVTSSIATEFISL